MAVWPPPSAPSHSPVYTRDAPTPTQDAPLHRFTTYLLSSPSTSGANFQVFLYHSSTPTTSVKTRMRGQSKERKWVSCFKLLAKGRSQSCLSHFAITIHHLAPDFFNLFYWLFLMKQEKASDTQGCIFLTSRILRRGGNEFQSLKVSERAHV